MAKVWVQVWTAQVAGSAEVEESELRQVQGLESLQKLIPMLVKVSEHSGWETVPNWGKQLVTVEETVEVLEPLELAEDLEKEKARQARETALAKGWGWVLREKE
jgi:hypothetical protein